MTVEVQQPRTRGSVARARKSRGGISRSQIVVLLAIFLCSAVVGYMIFQRFSPPATAATPTPTTAVRRGSITSEVNVTGSTAAVQQSKLTFGSAGRLLDVQVKIGDSVKAGDVLARIDTTDLEIQVAQAEVTLQQAKTKLTQLNAGSAEVEAAAAQASYESALTKYNDLKSSPTPEEISTASSAVRDAEMALANARNSLTVTQKSDTVSKNVRDRENEHNFYEVRSGETVAKFNRGEASQEDVDRDWSNLLTAKEKLDTARAQAELTLRQAENNVVKAEEALRKANDNLLDVQAGPTAAELKTSEASMLTAQAQMQAKTDGSAATTITAQEIAVRLAEATLKQKQDLLEQATLKAPFDGVVDAVNISVGDQISGTAEAISLINLREFRIDARVDEIDVAKLAPGQTAEVSIDALSGASLKAQVESIGATATSSQGVVSYPLVLKMEPSEAKVRPGMTASAVVEVARKDNVLLVPSRAVRTQGRNRTVTVMVNGQEETRTVQVGMTNDQSTEILSGLSEGDVVGISTTTTTSQSGAFPAGGGMQFRTVGPGGGMPAVPAGGFGR